ncbi:transposase [Streptomyces sp. NPDC006967]|uniref:transposase n=1 Tax=Streptomyces sp. NPDC006967 TaxID=3156906 RepID=UPI0033CCFDC3
MYGAVNHGWLEPRRLRRLLTSTPLPRAADGRIVLAVDVSNWSRPDAPTSPELLFCHVYGRGRSGSVHPRLALLLRRRAGDGTHVLDAIRLGPADDATAVTATQLREVVTRLVQAGQWRPGDADILVVMDTGYDVTRLAYVLADLPVELVGRLRSDRVMLRDAGPRRSTPRGGQPRKHGGVLTFSKPDSWQTTRPGHHVRHHPLRQGRSPRLGPDAPPPAGPRPLARPLLRTPPDPRHVDPTEGRAPAR